MKIEQLIVQYLYSNKIVSLPDIGTFTMSDVNISSETDKDVALPADAIQFQYDPKAQVDEGLITFIVQHTRKIRPLASSDLESFIMLNKQFLNIGKPLIIEGVGTLQKTQAGEYAFTQAGTSHVTHEEIPKPITEKQKEDVSFGITPREKSSGGSGKIALILLVLVLVAGASVAAWYFISHRHAERPAAETSSTASADATKSPTVDSAATKKMQDSLAAAAKPPAPLNTGKDSNNFYIIVVKEFSNHKAAQKSFDNFSSIGYRSMLSMPDSLHYQFRFPFRRSVADTVHVKDSLSKFFSAKTRVEIP